MDQERPPVHGVFSRQLGVLRGGQQPVRGAKVQLYAVGTSADGGPATPLLSPALTTDAGGSFDFTAKYSCPSPTSLLFIVASGGNPGFASATNNNALAMMAVLGACKDLSPSTFVDINEVTTVAAVFALAPFMSSQSAIGSEVGHASALARAFALAAELANPSSGNTPGVGIPPRMTAPVAEINTISDFLSTCINSTGGTAGDGSPCGRLFSLTTAAGITPAADTVLALLHLAQYPALNPDALFNLVPAAAPFQPTLAQAPQDWSVQLTPETGDPPAISPLNLVFSGTQAGAQSASQTVNVTTISGDPVVVAVQGPFQLMTPSSCPKTPCEVRLDFSPTATLAGGDTSLGFLSATDSLTKQTSGIYLSGSVTSSNSSTSSSGGSLTSIPGAKIAVYDFTAAHADSRIPDQLGNSAYAIPWPGTNPPKVTPQGLHFDGISTSCLVLPPAVSGVAAVSVYYSQFGEDYAGNAPNYYPETHTLFSGSVPGGTGLGEYSFVRLSSGLVAEGGDLYNLEATSDGAHTSSREAALGTHLWTYVPGLSSDQLGIDDHYVSNYLSQSALGPLFVPPYGIGCSLPLRGQSALGTIAYAILWSAAPTSAQLAATYQTIAALGETKGLTNSWGTPASSTHPKLACIGDSHTAGADLSTYCSRSNMPGLADDWDISVLATSGKFLPDMVAELPYELYKNVSADAPRKVIILDGGTNNFVDGNAPAALIESFFTQAADEAHAAGAKFIQQTYFSMCVNGGHAESMRDTLNLWIRANWRSYADAISDVGISKILGKDNDACTDVKNYDSSKFHLTNAGKAIEGVIAQNAVNNLYGSSETTPTVLTSTAAITSGENFVDATCSESCALTLPDATNNSGALFAIHADGTGRVTLAPSGPDTLNGGTMPIAIGEGTTITLESVPNTDTSIAGSFWVQR